jgi:ribosomal protein S18 acetylase RimI-like enzyme
LTISDITIREFEERDLEAVVRIEELSFPLPLPKIALLVLFETCYFYVAVVNEEIVGYIVLGYMGDESLHCFHIAVDPSYKRQGVASSLLRNGMARNPCRYYTTEVRKSNLEGRRFWESQGFKESPPDHKELNNRNESLILVRTLRNDS